MISDGIVEGIFNSYASLSKEVLSIEFAFSGLSPIRTQN